MRRALLILLLGLAAAPTAAVAQLPAPPAPVPLPPLPPLPTLPAPAPPAPAPVLPAVPAPATPTAPAIATPATSPSTPAAGGGSSGQTSSGASPAPSQSSGRAAPKRRPSVVLAFRASASGRTAIRLRQIAPVCRTAGRLLVPARSGANRYRFNGRVSGRPLRDGTYVATTPSGTVRFAIVGGKPTRSPKRLSPSVCDDETATANLAVAAPISVSPTPDRTEAAPAANIDRGATDEPGSIPHVLGTAFTDAAEAAASLHPAFYVLLGLAMAALAAAALPARVLPVATAGAVLARHRAAVTLAGTLGLLFVIVVYWVTLL